MTLGWEGLPRINTLAYWAIRKLRCNLSVTNTGAVLTLNFLHNL
jgi:hypothetical protein